MDPQINETTQPAPDAGENLRCKACGRGALDVVQTIISVETFRESVPCKCGESKEAAHSITELEARHISRGSLELSDRPALAEEWVDEWIQRDGGVVQEVISCRRCAENADWTSSERSVETETQRIEVVYRCGSCRHETEVADCHIAA